MRRLIPILVLLASMVIPTAAVRGEEWSVYSDSVHGCRIEYLLEFSARTSSTWRRISSVFSGPREDTFFRVMGVDNDEFLEPEKIRSTYLEENAPGDVVYDRTRDDFLVLSGYRGDSIFYTRIAVSGDKRTLCIVEIAYPREQKREFDQIVTRMSRSFWVE